MAEIVKENEIQWIKYGQTMNISLLAKDVIVLSRGNFLTFLEASRWEKKDIVYHANNETKGDGIRCICTHNVLYCFAFAEMCRNPRIFILAYPTFEVYKYLESVADSSFLAVKFSEMDYLVSLTGIPDFRIIVWNWKTAEKLYSQETKFMALSQSLRVTPMTPIHIIQAAPEDRRVLFWDMNICCKKTLLNKTETSLPESSHPPYCFHFGADGEAYFVDSKGSLYSINPDTHVCTLQIPYKDEQEESIIPCLAWYKGGLAFSVPGEVQLWRRKSPEGWFKVWSLAAKTPFKALLSSFLKELLIGVTTWNEILHIKGDLTVESVTLRSYGSNFEFLTFLNPVGDVFVTFGNEKKTFTCWNKQNGQEVSHYSWPKKVINAMTCNPRWPWLVVTTADGGANLINANDSHSMHESDEILLTKNPLNAIRFLAQGTHFCVANTDCGEFFLLRFQPFGRSDVWGYVKADLKIVDFAVRERENQMDLLIVPMSQFCCRSGQTILLYVLDEKQKSFEYVKDIALPTVVTSISVPPETHDEIFCIPHRSRHFFVMDLNNGKMISDHVSGHQMKSLALRYDDSYLLTYGVDGLVIIRATDSKKCATVFPTHQRLNRGTRQVIADPSMKYVLAVGWNGNLVCTLVRNLGINVTNKMDHEALIRATTYKSRFPSIAAPERIRARDRFSIPGLDFSKDRKKIWLESRALEMIALEELQNKKEKTSILEELSSIRKKLKQLLDENFANVPERQLPVQAFDLDKAARRKKLEDGKTEREKNKQFRLASMRNLNKVTDLIKKLCWDSVQVKGKEIHGIINPIAIQSYALLPDNASYKNKLTWLLERLNIEQFFRKGDYFEAWVPRTESSLELHINNKFQVSLLDVTQTIKTKYEEEQLEDDKTKLETEDQKPRYVWTGTSTHNFVEVDPHHYSQFELTTFLQSHEEIDLIEIDLKKLMLWFNKEFAETFALKEKEMVFVKERNNRLRHIINDLTYFNFQSELCKIQIYDPVWAPEEDPESIMKVEDHEVKVPMYVSESQYELLKKKEMEEERLKQLLLADDFRERALMTMMDGVLEKLWEEEIKKDVPKPRCMLEKTPEEYNEEDVKVVRTYEEAVKFLANERERYRKILEAEWSKTIIAVHDSASKFDEKVLKLHVLKLKVESAIGQEILKCLRIRQRCFQRIELGRKEAVLAANLMKNEKKIEALSQELNKLTEMLNDSKNYHETLQNKDRNLDKNFKKEFPDYSPIVCEQLYKLSKKRPRLTQRATAYASVLNDMGKCAVSGSKPEFMPFECIQYLKDIDLLDAHVNCPAAVTLQSWEMVCKMRRVKIDCELKIRACAVEVAEAESTVTNYQKALRAAKEMQVQLQNELQAVRSEKLNSSLNYQIQLVLKKGLVEIPLTGHIKDFAESVLVTKDILNDVNATINKTGKQKLKAMQKAANFRKGIIYKEWEHKKLRMEIEDLKNKLETVEKLQVLKELQAILVARARGFSDEKGFLYLENEIARAKENFKKTETEINNKMEELNSKTQKLRAQNKKLDEKIAEVNVEVNEMNLMRDTDFDQKQAAEKSRRMRRVRERARLARKIKDNHGEIVLLKAELELLRLKTYPSMKYKRS